MADARTRVSAQLVIGSAVVVLGVLFTLDNLNVLESEPILRWWPAVLVMIGLSKLLGLGMRPQTVAGTLFTAAGPWRWWWRERRWSWARSSAAGRPARSGIPRTTPTRS